jgi:redox-regulated HSP33 family molecular chaperone
MSDYTAFGLRIALGRPEQCHEEVTRKGELEPCDSTAVALRIDPHESEPYPVCARHARGDMVSLEAVVRFMLDRHEAQAVAASGLARMALEHGSTGEDQR